MKRSSDSCLIELVKVDNHLAFTLLVDRYREDCLKYVKVLLLPVLV
jgi:hypothetical protein